MPSEAEGEDYAQIQRIRRARFIADTVAFYKADLGKFIDEATEAQWDIIREWNRYDKEHGIGA